METNNIITAPQVADVDTAFKVWKQTNTGSKVAFYNFLVTPSPERDEFLTQMNAAVIYNGSIASVIIAKE